MDSLSATSLFSALNFIIIFVSSVSTDQTNITAEPGHDASLPCRSPDNKPVIVVEWIRPDLGSEYVLLYRNDQLDLENQHVMFRNRVDLLDRQMKDGNVSLALRNVTTDDRGEYECQVIQTEPKSQRMTVIIINLDVKSTSGDAGGGNRDGSDPVGLVVGVSVVLVVSLVVVILVYLSRKKTSHLSPKSDPPPVEPPEAQQPLTDQNQPAEQNPV